MGTHDPEAFPALWAPEASVKQTKPNSCCLKEEFGSVVQHRLPLDPTFIGNSGVPKSWNPLSHVFVVGPAS